MNHFVNTPAMAATVRWRTEIPISPGSKKKKTNKKPVLNHEIMKYIICTLTRHGNYNVTNIYDKNIPIGYYDILELRLRGIAGISNKTRGARSNLRGRDEAVIRTLKQKFEIDENCTRNRTVLHFRISLVRFQQIYSKTTRKQLLGFRGV